VVQFNHIQLVCVMVQDEEQIILDFLRQEALAGRLESTTTEIGKGVGFSYNRVGRILEHLIFKGQVAYRERGTQDKSVRYLYLKEIVNLCQGRWLQS